MVCKGNRDFATEGRCTSLGAPPAHRALSVPEILRPCKVVATSQTPIIEGRKGDVNVVVESPSLTLLPDSSSDTGLHPTHCCIPPMTTYKVPSGVGMTWTASMDPCA